MPLVTARRVDYLHEHDTIVRYDEAIFDEQMLQCMAERAYGTLADKLGVKYLRDEHISPFVHVLAWSDLNFRGAFFDYFYFVAHSVRVDTLVRHVDHWPERLAGRHPIGSASNRHHRQETRTRADV